MALRKSPSSRQSGQLSTRSGSSPTGQTVAGACNTDAHSVLKQAGYAVKEVYRVEPDLILWVDRFGRAKTSYIEAREKDSRWLCRVVTTIPGWPV